LRERAVSDPRAAEILLRWSPSNAEANSHLVRRVNADGSFQVLDATTGLERTMRLAVLAVSGQLTLVAVGDA
jgi:hypothetical protein